MSSKWENLPENWYDLVEDPNYLKHILYGDSVSGDSTTTFTYKKMQHLLTFDRMWDLLSLYYNPQGFGEKEYIFFDENIEILNYSLEKDLIEYKRPRYLMRHKINYNIVELVTKSNRTLKITKDHSLLRYNSKSNDFDKCNYNEVDYLPTISGTKLIPELSGIFIEEIMSFSEIPYDGYVYDFEVPETHVFFANGFLVHNTDSLFLHIPEECNGDVNKMLSVVGETSNAVNKLVVEYNTEHLLPKLGYDPKHNQTQFKEEMVISGMMFLDIKKNYAYKLVAKEGNVLETPEIKKTSGLAGKSDTIKMTKDILGELIKMGLTPEIEVKDRISLASKLINEKFLEFKDKINNFDLDEICTPSKWGKKLNIVYGMKLYNAIMEEPVFEYMMSGRFIYTKMKNLGKIKNLNLDFDIDKLSGICIPYKYDIDKIKSKLVEYEIDLDYDTQWDKIYSTTCKRVISLFKGEILKLNDEEDED